MNARDLRQELETARDELVLLLATIREANIAENVRRVLERVERALEMLPRAGPGRPANPDSFAWGDASEELRGFVELVDLRFEIAGVQDREDARLPGSGKRLEAIAKRYNRSVKTIEGWIKEGRIPPEARLSGKKSPNKSR